MEFQDEFIDKLNTFHNAPFLFIGSGISRRYVNLDDWNELLKRFSKEMDKEYSYYYSKAGGNLPKVATLIAKDYHEYWFTANKTDIDEGRYSPDELINIESPLKIEIASYLKGIVEEKEPEIASNEEIKLLKDAKFNGIITTNYDNFLERIFPDLVAYVGQEELIFSNPQFIGEIYKIHGSSEIPNSLIITTEDFHRFNEKNAYLAAKLLTIFVEHPIIFLGYSLQDPDIQLILTSIASCLTNENISKIRNNLIFVIWEESTEPQMFPSSFVINEKINIPITVIRTNDFSPIYDALGALERKLPARLIRQLKEQFFQFLITNKPSESCKVLVDLEDLSPGSPVEFVVGVGVIKRIGTWGWKAFDRDRLFNDLLFEDKRCDPERIVKDILPRLLTHRSHVPIFKYLKKAGYLSEGGILSGAGIDSKVLQRASSINSLYFRPSPAYERHRDRIFDIHSITDLKERFDTFHSIFYIPLLELREIDPEELREYLIEISQEFREGSTLSNYRSIYVKLICLYDWLKYGAGDSLTVRME